jgi:hypothetical protein
MRRKSNEQHLSGRNLLLASHRPYLSLGRASGQAHNLEISWWAFVQKQYECCVLLVMTPCSLIYTYQNFFLMKPNRRTKFSNLLRHETLHVSGSSFVHHQELFTVHSAMVYVIQVWRQLSSRTRMEQSSILVLLASCRVSCLNKCEKLVCLVGFIKTKFVTMQRGHMNVKYVPNLECYILLLSVIERNTANASNLCPFV